MAEGSVNLSCRVADIKVVTHNRLLLVVVQSGLMPTSPSFMSVLFQCLNMAYSEIFLQVHTSIEESVTKPIG